MNKSRVIGVVRKMPLTSSEVTLLFLKYLKENKDTFLNAWEKNIKTDGDDSFLPQIRINGSLMFDLTVKLLEDQLPEKEVEALAQKVAKERAKANVNIGDFIKNVYKGRNIILEQIYQLNLTNQEFLIVSNRVNDLYDRFIVYAVSKYSEYKDAEIKEKMLFIKDTHKDRLTLLGQMSSSFVHEFRNPLTAVMGFVKLIKAGHYNDLYIETIEHELEELNFRITQFLHTSKIKIDDPSSKPFNLVALIEELIQFLYPSLVADDISVQTNFQFEDSIEGIEEEIKQVLLNLLMNAIEAVKSKESGSNISISTNLENNYLKLQIANNGPKIPEQTLSVIFEPFFTTKELGTGIGLFVCKKIIETHHHGKIECNSTDDLTTFTIYLPLLIEA